MRRVFDDTGLPVRSSVIPDRRCACCGATGEVLSFSFIVSSQITQTINYCRVCTQGVASFLASVWAEQSTQARDLRSDENMMTIADAQALQDINRLLYVCVHLAASLSGSNLRSPEMEDIQEGIRSLVLILLTRGMPPLPSGRE